MIDQKSKIRKARTVGDSLVVTIPAGWANEGDVFSITPDFDGFILKIVEHGKPKETQHERGWLENFKSRIAGMHVKVENDGTAMLKPGKK